MGWLTLEHSRAAYLADFAFYGMALLLLSAALAAGTPVPRWPAIGATVAAGLAAWTLAEYAVHRLVLHGLEPFRAWHAEHHRRPQALIYTPTLISAAAIGLLVWLPAALLMDRWTACALTLGVVAGAFGYALTHHALHRGPTKGPWLRGRRRWHALHHGAGSGMRPGRYGVTSSFWDGVFGTARTR